MYDIKVGNCTNAQCAVVNIRAAKAGNQVVTKEIHRQREPPRRPVVVDWQAVMQEDGQGAMVRKQSTDSSAPNVIPAVCKLVEPCFVNPASQAAVKELLRHAGEQEAGWSSAIRRR